MSHTMTKPTKWPVRPVWSESSQCAQWVTKDPRFLHVDIEDWSDWADAQADLSLRSAPLSFCWFCHAEANISFVLLRIMIISLQKVGYDVVRFCMVCFDRPPSYEFSRILVYGNFLFNLNIRFVLCSIVITSRGEGRADCCYEMD